MSAIDRIISIFSPRKALERAIDRARYESVSRRSYEGASRAARTRGWGSSHADADAEIVGDNKMLRARARKLVRDDPYACAAVEKWADGIVGMGVTPRPVSATGDLIAAWEEFQAEADFDGGSFYSLQRRVARAVFESGGCLVVRRIVDGKLKLQTLEPDHLDDQVPFSATNGNVVIGGKEFDKSGRLVAYWLFDRHPGTMDPRGSTLVSKRVVASEVLHIFEPLRPGQHHGVSRFASVVRTMHGLDDYYDAMLVGMRTSACFAGFVSNADGTSSLGEPETEQDGNVIESLRPGTVNYLKPGESVTFATPPSVDGSSTFLESNLHGVAAGLGMPYELLTGDYSKSSFSSARMAHIPFRRSCEIFRNLFFVPLLCKPVWDWFYGVYSLSKGISAKSPVIIWTGTKWDPIDPEGEAKADKINVENGFETWRNVVANRGYDPEQQISEISMTNDALDSAGVKLMCDPRFANQKGGSDGQAKQ